MTDAPSLPVAPPVLLEEQLGLSYAEVLSLLSLGPGPAADRTREVLMLDTVENAEQIGLIGASGLLARGLLAFTEDGKSLAAINQALYIRVVLTTATRWTNFQATDGAEGGDSGFFIESPAGKLLMQPRALDTWWFVLLHPEAPAEDVVADTAMLWGELAPEMAIFLRTQTMDADRAFTIHVAAGIWSFAYGVTGEAEPDARSEAASREDVERALKSFIRDFPATASSS